jgi:hypothetical protein
MEDNSDTPPNHGPYWPDITPACKIPDSPKGPVYDNVNYKMVSEFYPLAGQFMQLGISWRLHKNYFFSMIVKEK